MAPTLGSAYGADRPGSQRRPHVTVGDPGKLGAQIHRAAKALGGRPLPAGLVPELRPGHSTDLYAGLARLGGAHHGQYRTFRTIKAGTEPKWLHPGIAPRRLHKEAQRYLGKIAAASAQHYLAGVLNGKKGKL